MQVNLYFVFFKKKYDFMIVQTRLDWNYYVLDIALFMVLW